MIRAVALLLTGTSIFTVERPMRLVSPPGVEHRDPNCPPSSGRQEAFGAP